MDFYSARLLFIILVSDGRPRKRNRYNETVVVFRARDWEHAHQLALELGLAEETTYKSRSNQTVRWALVEVLALDFIGRKVDGSEVASRMFQQISKEPVSPTVAFQPGVSTPPQSCMKGSEQQTKPAPNTLVPRDQNPRERGFGPVNSDR